MFSFVKRLFSKKIWLGTGLIKTAEFDTVTGVIFYEISKNGDRVVHEEIYFNPLSVTRGNPALTKVLDEAGIKTLKERQSSYKAIGEFKETMKKYKGREIVTTPENHRKILDWLDVSLEDGSIILNSVKKIRSN